MSETAGYRWCQPLSGEDVVELAGGERTVPYHFVYSITERPTPGSTISATGPPTWTGTSPRSGRPAWALEAAGRNPDGSLTWAYCRGSSGPRIELVTRSLEPMLSRLWS